jgi:hypothetical protein
MCPPDRFPVLYEFFRTHLHEDWELVYDDPEEAFDDFVATQPGEAMGRLVLEVELLSAQGEGSFVESLYAINPGFSVVGTYGDDAKAWLRTLADRASASRDETDPRSGT